MWETSDEASTKTQGMAQTVVAQQGAHPPTKPKLLVRFLARVHALVWGSVLVGGV